MGPFPLHLMARLGSYLVSQKLSRKNHTPLVLMLEPTFRCNLKCSGCGKVREYHGYLDRQMSADECLNAARECGAPVVSITGGEPLVHPQIGEIANLLIRDRRYVNLCTNGLLLRRSLSRFTPDKRLSFVVHIDGFAKIHDAIAELPGAFDGAIDGIRAAKDAGFRVLTNTTVFSSTDAGEIASLLRFLADLGVDGSMIAPAFGYEHVVSQGSNDSFLRRDEAHELFSRLFSEPDLPPFYHTPTYLRVLTGDIDLPCSPWSTPTRNPVGWKRPCYLITDEHVSTYQELIDATPWDRYGRGRDPRCTECAMHCGFEGSAVEYLMSHPLNAIRRPVSRSTASRESVGQAPVGGRSVGRTPSRRASAVRGFRRFDRSARNTPSDRSDVEDHSR